MLYIVGTPIGNLNDLSLRQVQTIASADIILAEDTRSAGLLLAHIHSEWHVTSNKNQKLISYYKEKEFEKLPEIISFLKEDLKVVLISESGMPSISDPGHLLISTVIREKLPFIVVPGPTAFATVLVYSGFSGSRAMFMGFLSKRESEVLKSIKFMLAVNDLEKKIAFIFYESAQRIRDTLLLFDKLAPAVDIVVGRELTKKFEEVIRGKPGELTKRAYRGELTVVVHFP